MHYNGKQLVGTNRKGTTIVTLVWLADCLVGTKIIHVSSYGVFLVGLTIVVPAR